MFIHKKFITVFIAVVLLSGCSAGISNSESIHSSMFSSISQNNKDGIYYTYVDNILYPTNDKLLYGDLVVAKYKGEGFDKPKILIHNASNPITGFDKEGQLYISYIDIRNNSIKYIKYNDNNDIVVHDTKIKSTNFKNSNMIRANFPNKSNNINYFSKFGSSIIIPNWYDMTQYAFNIYDDKAYFIYNNSSSGITLNICNIANNKCDNDIELKDKDYDYATFDSIENNYVTFNEGKKNEDDSHIGVLKKIEQQGNSFSLKQMCDTLPGKIISKPVQLISGSKNYLFVEYGTKDGIHVAGCDTNTNIWDDRGIILGTGKIDGQWYQDDWYSHVWYPQILNYNNTIVSISRHNEDATDCTENKPCKIYAKQLINGKWVDFGNNNGVVSDINTDSDLPQIAIQNDILYINYLTTVDEKKLIFKPVIKKFNRDKQNWDVVCNGVIGDISKQSRRVGNDFGGFVIKNNSAIVSFIELVEGYTNIQGAIDYQKSSYKTQTTTCQI